MDELNYRQLLYFWVVTQAGSVTRASRKLHVAQPTVSAQLKKFEHSLGTRLFRRAGRKLELTETGRKVRRYAEQIFSLGDRLLAEIHGRDSGQPQLLSVGVAEEIPAAAVESLLAAAWTSNAASVAIHIGTTRELLSQLADQKVDLVLSAEAGDDYPAIRTHSRLLLESPIVLVGTKQLALPIRRGFPGSLQHAPLILPTANSKLRTAIDRWLQQHHLTPRVVVETNNEGWQRCCCEAGRGLMVSVPLPSHSTLQTAGQLSGVKLPCFAITLDRQPANSLVRAVLDVRGSRAS